MNSSVESQISTLFFELKNSKLKIKNMKRSIFLKKRKIKDEQIELKNLILMLKKEIGRMNETIGNSRSKFSSNGVHIHLFLDKLAEADPSFIQGQDLSSVREFDTEKLNTSLSEYEVDEDIMDSVSVVLNLSF